MNILGQEGELTLQQSLEESSESINNVNITTAEQGVQVVNCVQIF